MRRKCARRMRIDWKSGGKRLRENRNRYATSQRELLSARLQHFRKRTQTRLRFVMAVGHQLRASSAGLGHEHDPRNATLRPRSASFPRSPIASCTPRAIVLAASMCTARHCHGNECHDPKNGGSEWRREPFESKHGAEATVAAVHG